MTRRVVTLATAVMTTLLALLLLWQFKTAVVYVLISLALAAAVRPLVTRRAGRSFIMRLALILLYLLALGSFGLLLFLSGGAAIRDLQELARLLSAQDAWRQPVWLQGDSFQQLLDAWLPPPSELFAALIGDQGQFVLPAVLGFTQNIFSILSGILVILFLSLYWGIDQNHFERLWLSLLPPGQRTQVRDIWQTIESDLGAYIRSEAIKALLAGLLLGLGYWALGSPSSALLALTGALALLIPLVGVFLALILPLLLGLLTGGPLSLLTVLYTLGVAAALKWWVTPRLASRRQDNPMLTAVILMALANAYGLLGIIIAPPLSAACQIAWSRLVGRRAVFAAEVQISDLKARQAQLWEIIREMDGPLPLVTSSMERLGQLIEKAEPVLETAVEKRG
jgi:predicted PurR-regulated permease PerM